jgi:hypothetical protein
MPRHPAGMIGWAAQRGRGGDRWDFGAHRLRGLLAHTPGRARLAGEYCRPLVPWRCTT